jgi:hypothetical protein
MIAHILTMKKQRWPVFTAQVEYLFAGISVDILNFAVQKHHVE